MSYIALDTISYLINGERFELNRNAKITQERAIEYFKTQGVIDGLLEAKRLEKTHHADTAKIKDTAKSIVDTIANKMANFVEK